MLSPSSVVALKRVQICEALSQCGNLLRMLAVSSDSTEACQSFNPSKKQLKVLDNVH